MRKMEQQAGISSMQATRERTRILQRYGRSGCQQYFDRGFGRLPNPDYEPLHGGDC